MNLNTNNMPVVLYCEELLKSRQQFMKIGDHQSSRTLHVAPPPGVGGGTISVYLVYQ